MWGLKENTDKQFADHQRAFQQGIAASGKSVATGIDRFYILGQWMAPLKLCTKLDDLPTGKPCKAWMNANGMKIETIDGIKTFDFDMNTYIKWHAYWKTEVMGKPDELAKIVLKDKFAPGNIGVSDKFMETMDKM